MITLQTRSDVLAAGMPVREVNSFLHVLVCWQGQVLSAAQQRHLDSCRGRRKLGVPPEGEEGAVDEEEEEEEEDDEQAFAIRASRVCALVRCSYWSYFVPRLL